MRALCALLCLLTLAFYLISSSPPSSASPSTAPRQLRGRWLTLSPTAATTTAAFRDEEAEEEEAEGKMERPPNNGYSAGQVDESSERFISNEDYHGVTTHPSPLPGHPRP